MAATEADAAAKLIERLLGDPAFRTEFRRDPATACRKAGLDSLADEMALGAGKAMMTLDVRESKSSLAGVMMAAAMEGVGVYQFGEHVLPHIDDIPGVVGDVLSRVSLPALPGQGALAGSPATTAAPPPAAEEAADAADGAAGGGAAAAAAAPAAPAVPPEEAAAADGKAAKAAEAAEKAAAEKQAAAAVPPEQAAAAKIAEQTSPEAEKAEQVKEAVEKIAEETDDLPSASDMPDAGVAPQPVEEVGAGAGAPAPEQAAPAAAAAPVTPPEAAAPAPAAPPEAAAPAPAAPAAVEQVVDAPAVARKPVDPDQFGGAGQGTGGEPDPEALALLQNKNVILDDVGIADIKEGRIDPRVVAVLTKLSQEHEIKVSCMCSDHSQFTAGGSVSNHFYGRGLDIAAIDGKIVNSGNFDAREIATELQELDPSMRPNEIGTPWAISGPGYFTDAAHQDHLHFGFKQEITTDWQPPADVAAAGQPAAAAVPGAPVAVAAAVPGAPVAAVAAEPPAPKPGDSLSFKAVTAEDAAEAAAKPKKGDSLAFMQAVEQPQQPAVAQAAAAPVAPPEAAAAAVDLAGVTSAYPGDDAPKEQVAAWMAKMAQDRGLPPELPLMASLVESGMTNIQGGDADSIGFFQMRVGIWNQGDYAGYPDKPELQVKWFLDQAEQVKDARIAAGKPIDDPNSFGEWIADVERPAEQYRGRYQLKLEEAEGLLKSHQAPAAAVTPGAPAAVEQVVDAPAVARKPVDPDQFGGAGQGTGGEPDPEALALLQNKNVILDDVGIADIKEGRIDPRVVAVLTKLSQEHEIKVSCMCSDHSQFTAGGSVSNHFYGRGLDIAAIDGKIVNSGNFDAREIATELQELDPSMRPNEIGTPWAISGPGYFTDAAHQDHLHFGFKQEITTDWQPPADVAATGQPAVAAAAAAPGAPAQAPAAAAAAAPPAPKPGDSLSFKAVTAEDAAEAAAKPKKGDSLAFMQAVDPATAPAAAQPAGPASALASHAASPSAVADAAAATAAGGSPLGASALGVAQGELGVKESGYNTGVDVNKYLAAADVAPGNPWCASFVTWSLAESGKQMEGGGWAAVQTWVRNAEQGNQGLQIVSAEDARPGDLVAYDWGHQEDFAADGHIGFLASNVEGGKFTALEGNYQDAVLRVPRDVGSANVKFIRVTGDAPAGAPVAAAPAVAPVAPVAEAVAPAPPAAVEGAAPPAAVEGAAPLAAVETPAAAQPAAAAAAAVPPEAAPAAPAVAAAAEAKAAAPPEAAQAGKHDSLQFMAVEAETARKHHATVQFMKAIDPKEAQAAAATPAAGVAAPVVPPEAAASAVPATPSAAADAAMVQDVGAPVPAGELNLMDVGPIGTYPGDKASPAELAKWLGDEAERAGLPRELPVMAALTESRLQNVKGGDADSAGFFQMRVGIWDSGPYEGYRTNPHLQAQWFIDQALAIKRKRIAAGDVNFGKDPGRWGEWIADVERPAAEYRGRYQTHLGEARGLVK